MDTIVTGKTKLYAVIGDPISHSFSPEIHNRIFKELETDGMYISLRISPDELKNAIPFLRDNFQGFNVTIPHKEAIMPLLDELDDRARIYGAVNTVKVEGGKLKGYNTDGFGFMKSLEDLQLKVKNKNSLILGAGGAARVIAYELIVNGSNVTLANRSEDKALKLKKDLEGTTGGNLKVVKLEDIMGDYDYIINTTPVGMSATSDLMPIGENILKNAKVVYDLIYNPSQTKLLKTANQYNATVINGFSMLFFQAVKAQEIWFNNSINRTVTSTVLAALTDEEKSI